LWPRRLGYFINVSGEINADWALPEEQRWCIPFGAGFGRTFPILGQPMTLQASFAAGLQFDVVARKHQCLRRLS
jgi:hypothetical protein